MSTTEIKTTKTLGSGLQFSLDKVKISGPDYNEVLTTAKSYISDGWVSSGIVTVDLTDRNYSYVPGTLEDYIDYNTFTIELVKYTAL